MLAKMLLSSITKFIVQQTLISQALVSLVLQLILLNSKGKGQILARTKELKRSIMQ